MCSYIIEFFPWCTYMEELAGNYLYAPLYICNNSPSQKQVPEILILNLILFSFHMYLLSAILS